MACKFRLFSAPQFLIWVCLFVYLLVFSSITLLLNSFSVFMLRPRVYFHNTYCDFPIISRSQRLISIANRDLLTCPLIETSFI
jgi:hypothetical protein